METLLITLICALQYDVTLLHNFNALHHGLVNIFFKQTKNAMELTVHADVQNVICLIILLQCGASCPTRGFASPE